MVLGNFGYSLVLNLQDGKNFAAKKVNLAIHKIEADFSQIQSIDRELALHLAHDQSFLSAYASQDRPAIANIIRTAMDQRSFAGFVTLIDERGRIFYSSDTAAKSGFTARDRSSGVEYVFRNLSNYMGLASFTPTGVITISSMIPMGVTGGRVSGVIVASQPLDSEFLIGEVTKLAILSEPLVGIDIVLLSGRDGSLIQATPGLISENSAFLRSLRENGIRALPNSPLDNISNWFAGLFNTPGAFERSGRWWRQLNLEGVPSRASSSPELVGVLLVSTPIPNPTGRIASGLYLYATTGALAMLAALVLTSWIARGINAPVRLLTKRVTDLGSQKPNVTNVEGLSGDWRTLSDRIDEALVSMRSTIQNLKGQVSKLNEDSADKQQKTDTSDSQFDALNRQVSTQSRQLTELSKQINYSSRQSVMLQQRLDAVLQTSTEAFLILDQFGNILSSNTTFLNWMGVTEGEIAGRYCFDLIKKPGEPQTNEVQGRAFSRHSNDPQALINEFYPEGVVYNKRSEKAIEVLAHLQPIGGPDSKIEGYVMVLRDKSLRSEIAQLKAEIVSMLSGSIRGALVNAEETWQTILRNAPQTMHPSVGQSLAELHKNYETLLGVTDSLLMIHGGFIPPPAVPRETFIISRVVADCLEEMATAARERQLALDYKSVTGLPNMTGNREALRIVLSQILEKMIAGTAPGGRVRVETVIKGSEVRFGISSSGPALPEGEIADMFAGFIPAKHSEDTYSTRLSMYLARNHVERMGGKIWAESEAGRGTIIYFTLPLS
jgi:PAS domain S-box-containing protein